jgi:AraC-like DNA-binding protein
VDILSLAGELHTNSRTLQRRFKSIIGLTPKQYAEIVRFTKLFDFLMSNEKVSLLEKLHALGYYDQAHAIRAFKKYAGFSPRKIIHEQFRLAAGLSGPFAGAVRESD